jgi:hypothetical protein
VTASPDPPVSPIPPEDYVTHVPARPDPAWPTDLPAALDLVDHLRRELVAAHAALRAARGQS